MSDEHRERLRQLAAEMRSGLKTVSAARQDLGLPADPPSPSLNDPPRRVSTNHHTSFWKFGGSRILFEGRACYLRFVHVEDTGACKRLTGTREAYPCTLIVLLTDIEGTHSTRIGDVTYERITKAGSSMRFLPSSRPPSTSVNTLPNWSSWADACCGMINVVLRALTRQATGYFKPTTEYGHDEFAAFMSITPAQGRLIARTLETDRAALAATVSGDEPLSLNESWLVTFERDEEHAVDGAFDLSEEADDDG